MRRGLILVALLALPRLVAAQQTETVGYLRQDLIGSIRIVWDANGNVVARQDYAPFGKPLSRCRRCRRRIGEQEKDAETDQDLPRADADGANRALSSPDPIQAGLGNRHSDGTGMPTRGIVRWISPIPAGWMPRPSPVPVCRRASPSTAGSPWSLWFFFSGFGWVEVAAGFSYDGGGGGGSTAPTPGTPTSRPIPLRDRIRLNPPGPNPPGPNPPGPNPPGPNPPGPRDKPRSFGDRVRCAANVADDISIAAFTEPTVPGGQHSAGE